MSSQAEISSNGVERELTALRRQLCLDPAHRLPTVEVEGRCWQINQMDSFVLGELVFVGMPVHDRFDLRHRPDDVKEATGIQQINLGRVMKAQNGGLFIRRVEEGLQPSTLLSAKQTGRPVDEAECVKDHKSDRAGVDRDNVSVFDRSTPRSLTGEHLEEMVSIIVVSNTKTDGPFPGDRRQQRLEVVVGLAPAVSLGEIARNNETVWQIRFDAGYDFLEIQIGIEAPTAFIRRAGDVGIGKKCPPDAVAPGITKETTRPQCRNASRES